MSKNTTEDNQLNEDRSLSSLPASKISSVKFRNKNAGQESWPKEKLHSKFDRRKTIKGQLVQNIHGIRISKCKRKHVHKDCVQRYKNGNKAKGNWTRIEKEKQGYIRRVRNSPPKQLQMTSCLSLQHKISPEARYQSLDSSDTCFKFTFVLRNAYVFN